MYVFPVMFPATDTVKLAVPPCASSHDLFACSAGDVIVVPVVVVALWQKLHVYEPCAACEFFFVCAAPPGFTTRLFAYVGYASVAPLPWHP